MTKTRKPLNEADRLAAAEARSVKLEALHTDLAEQVESLATSEGWLAMLHAAARFRTYSMNNSMLIALQLAMRGMDPNNRVAGLLKVGDQIKLHWVADNNTDTVRLAGLHIDMLHVEIIRGNRRMRFLLNVRTCPDNSARMIRRVGH